MYIMITNAKYIIVYAHRSMMSVFIFLFCSDGGKAVSQIDSVQVLLAIEVYWIMLRQSSCCPRNYRPMNKKHEGRDKNKFILCKIGNWCSSKQGQLSPPPHQISTVISKISSKDPMVLEVIKTSRCLPNKHVLSCLLKQTLLRSDIYHVGSKIQT